MLDEAVSILECVVNERVEKFEKSAVVCLRSRKNERETRESCSFVRNFLDGILASKVGLIPRQKKHGRFQQFLKVSIVRDGLNS